MKITLKSLPLILFTLWSGSVFADEIGHGKSNTPPDSTPIEESETAASSFGSFFDELLEIFTVKPSDE